MIKIWRSETGKAMLGILCIFAAVGTIFFFSSFATDSAVGHGMQNVGLRLYYDSSTGQFRPIGAGWPADMNFADVNIILNDANVLNPLLIYKLSHDSFADFDLNEHNDIWRRLGTVIKPTVINDDVFGLRILTSKVGAIQDPNWALSFLAFEDGTASFRFLYDRDPTGKTDFAIPWNTFLIDAVNDIWITRYNAHNADARHEWESRAYAGADPCFVVFDCNNERVGFGIAEPDVNHHIVGDARWGDDVNYTNVGGTGDFSFGGDATVWDDLPPTPITAAKLGSSAPTLATFKTDIEQYTFDATNDYVIGATEITHKWKEGTIIVPHIHFATNGSEGTAKGIQWQLKWAVGDVTEAFSAQVTSVVDVTIDANTPDRTHYLSNLNTTLDGTNLKIGAYICWRFERIATAHGNGEPASDPFGIAVGFHAEMDMVGSRTIGAK